MIRLQTQILFDLLIMSKSTTILRTLNSILIVIAL